MARPFIIGSAALAVISIATFAVKGKEGIGIDFRGGAVTRFDVPADANVTAAAAQDALKAAGVEGAYVQRNTAATGTLLTVRTEFEDGDKAKRLIEEKFAGVKGSESERIGSVVGKELAVRSSVAYVLAISLIFLYLIIFYELSFAVGAMLALLHDCLIALGISVLLGQQLSIIHIGAVLAIAGYSINDTIIVFDRIREMLRSRSGDIRDIMNEAISKTLSRTLLTSSTTLVPMIVLLIFGGPAMKDFSLPIIIGVIVGTYSSMYIASPLVLWWAKKTGKSLRRQVLDSDAKNIKPPVATA
jgi:SecD/SecF fusion protein